MFDFRAIAQALMNGNGNAFGGARVSGRNSLANMPGLQERMAQRRTQQPMAPQPQQPVQFTQPRVHAQGPGGASTRWMELFRG